MGCGSAGPIYTNKMNTIQSNEVEKRPFMDGHYLKETLSFL